MMKLRTWPSNQSSFLQAPRLWSAALLMAGVSGPGIALAACTSTFPQGGPGTGHVIVNITVPAELPVGGEIPSSEFIRLDSIGAGVFECDAPVGSIRTQKAPSVEDGSRPSRSTFPGLGGIEISNQLYLPGSIPVAMPTDSARVLTSRLDLARLGSTRMNLGRVYKTGEVAPGTFSGLIANAVLSEHGNYEIMRYYATINVNVSQPTCEVDTRTVLLDIGSVTPDALSHPGAVSRPSSAGVIRVTCNGGTPGARAAIYAALTDNNQPGNTSDELSLSDEGVAGTAGGVKIQILREGSSTALPLGPIPTDVTPAHLWFAGNWANGTESITLRARYVRVNGPLGAGRADGAATFTLIHQ